MFRLMDVELRKRKFGSQGFRRDGLSLSLFKSLCCEWRGEYEIVISHLKSSHKSFRARARRDDCAESFRQSFTWITGINLSRTERSLIPLLLTTNFLVVTQKREIWISRHLCAPTSTKGISFLILKMLKMFVARKKNFQDKTFLFPGTRLRTHSSEACRSVR